MVSLIHLLKQPFILQFKMLSLLCNQQKEMNIEVCYTPQAYQLFHNPNAIVVVIDILRATSAITTAFLHAAGLPALPQSERHCCCDRYPAGHFSYYHRFL
jgi:hypothetical protein